MSTVGQSLDDALRQLTEQGAKHEGRLGLLEASDNSDMAWLKEQIGYIKQTLDLLLLAAKADEERHENG